MGDTKTGAGGPPTDADNMVGMAKLLGLTGQVGTSDIFTALQKKLAEPATQQVVVQPAPPPAVQQPQNVVLTVPAPATGQQQPVSGQLVTLSDGTQAYLVPTAATAPTGQQVVTQPQGQQGGGNGPGLNLGSILQPVKLDGIEGDPVALADVVKAQNEKIGLLASAHKLAESQAFIAQLHEGNGSIGLSPVVRDLALELMVKAPAALSETVQKLLTNVAEGKATVALGELGRSRTANASSVIQQFEQELNKLRKDNDGMTYADAVDALARRDPRLAEAYRVATMAGEE